MLFRSLFSTFGISDKALSDGPNMIPLAEMPKVLKSLVRVYEAVRA